MIGRTLALGFALVCLAAGAVYAQVDYARNGFYVGLGGTYAIDAAAQDALGDAVPGYDVDIDDMLGLNTRVGYRFHPNFSAEAHFEWLDKTDISAEGIKAATLWYWTLSADVKAFLLRGRFQPFALVGTGLMYAKAKEAMGYGLSASDVDFAARFGGGIDIYATKSIVVSVDASYVLPTGSLEDLDYVSIGWGLQYRF